MREDSNVVALMPWGRAIRRAHQKKKNALLLDQKDADAAIKNLDEIEAYYLVKDVGLEDASPILAHLKRDQIRAILDLDVWHRHALDRADLLLWLEVFRDGGLDALHNAAQALDPEVLGILFARRLLIAFKPKEDEALEEETPQWVIEPPQALEPLMETPDGRFIVAARADDDGEKLDQEERKTILRIVHDLYKDKDWERVAGILRLAKDDSPSDLEEEALRFRNARIEDFGFAPYERAVEVYGPMDPSALEDEVAPYPRGDLRLPSIHASQLANGLFHAAMEMITDREIVERIEADLLPLANEVLVADGVEPGAIETIRESLVRLRGYVELALTHETDGEERLTTAAHRLRHVPVRTLFKVGYGLTLRRKTTALEMERDRRFVDLLEEADREVLAGLTMKRPRAPNMEPFTPESFAKISAQLEEIVALHVLYRSLDIGLLSFDGVLEPPVQERTIDLWIATAAVWAIVGSDLDFSPLDGAALLEVADRLPALADHRLRLTEIPPAWGVSKDHQALLLARIQRKLDLLSEALWPLVGSSTIDLRFVDGVIRRLTPV